MGNDTEGDKVLAEIETAIKSGDRVREKRLPISWEGWDQYDTMVFGFTDVYFHADFGMFKAGERIGSISIDYEDGLLIEYAENGSEIRSQSWVMIPLSED